MVDETGESSFKNKEVILFDLGGTLIEYYQAKEFPAILEQGITNIINYLTEKYNFNENFDDIWKRVKKENYEMKNFKVRPLEDRLDSIFKLNDIEEGKSLQKLTLKSCSLFMEPIFQISKIYNDTIPCLEKIKQTGLKIGLISNTPWGCPSFFWKKELEKYQLNTFFDEIVFCRDVGWRKPAKQIFELMIKNMQVKVEKCLFIGDDRRWDLIGPNNIGMDALIINRTEKKRVYDATYIKNLYQLLDNLKIPY